MIVDLIEVDIITRLIDNGISSDKYDTATIGEMVSLVTMGGKSLSNNFKQASNYERGEMISIILKSKHKEVAEQIVVRLLNDLHIKGKEQLDEIFDSIEHIITDNIRSKVVIEKSNVIQLSDWRKQRSKEV